MSTCACIFEVYHLSGEADAAAILPGASGPGEAQTARRAVDGFQGGADGELGRRATVGGGASARDMGQDFSLSAVHVFQGDGIYWVRGRGFSTS